MERFNIYANNEKGNRLFNLGIITDKTEEWVKEEVSRLNAVILKDETVTYGYEEI